MQLPYSAVSKIFAFNRSTFKVRLRRNKNDQNQTDQSRIYSMAFEMVFEINNDKRVDKRYYDWIRQKLLQRRSFLGNFTDRMLRAADGSFAFYRFRFNGFMEQKWNLNFEMYTRTQSFNDFEADVVEALTLLYKELFQAHDAPLIPSVYDDDMSEKLRKYYNFVPKPFYMYKLVKELNITPEKLDDMTILLQSNTNLPLSTDREVPTLPRLRV